MRFVDNIKTRVKMTVSFLWVASIVVGVAGIGYFNTWRINQNLTSLYQTVITPLDSLGRIESDVLRVDAALLADVNQAQSDQDHQKEIRSALADIDSQLMAIEVLNLGGISQTYLNSLQSEYESFKTAANDALAMIEAEDWDGARGSVESGAFNDSFSNMRTGVNAMLTWARGESATLKKQMDTAYSQTTWWLGLGALSGVIVAVALGLGITNSITRPLSILTRSMHQLSLGNLADEATENEVVMIAQRKDEIGGIGQSILETQVYLDVIAQVATCVASGDLTVPVEAKSENDTLGLAFAQMSRMLKEVIHQLMTNAVEIGHSAQNLSVAAGQAGLASSEITATIQQVALGIGSQASAFTNTASSVEQMNRAISGVAHGASEQANSVNQASALTERIFASIQDISVSADQQAKSSAQAVDKVNENAHMVQETAQGMQNIREKVNQSAEIVREMGKRSNEIGMIVSTIDEIASQTNLLSLNAAIEAARAGEHGKGFAVVADEVRKLAEKSALATKEISALVKLIQGSVAESIRSMDESGKEVERGAKLADQSQAALDMILQAAVDGKVSGETIAANAASIQSLADDLVSAMERVSAVVEENSAATQEMSAGSAQVTQAVESVASVSEENSAAVQQISASAEEMSAQVNDVSDSSNELCSVVQHLNMVVGHFVIDVDEDAHTFISMVKQAHQAWVTRLHSAASGHVNLRMENLTDDHSCSMGKWYFGVGKQRYGSLPEFVALEEPHAHFHHAAEEAVAAYLRKDMPAFEHSSQDVFSNAETIMRLLDALEEKIG